MFKYLILFMFYVMCSKPLLAQVYNEDQIVVESNDNYNEDEELERKGTFGKYVNGDTLIDFNNYNLPLDSIAAWKKNKKYKWINGIESYLKSNKEEQEKESHSDFETNRKIGNSVSSTQNFLNSTFLKTLLWLLALVFVLYIVYKLFLNKGLFISNKSQKNVSETIEIVDENNMNNDFDYLYINAFKEGDFRLAMRYIFLGLIKKLDNKNYIKYVQDKTNVVYASELPPKFRNEFSRLTLYYEYIWYGKFNIDEQTFLKIETEYKNFNIKD